jgi:hypothetical protein
MQTKYIDIDGAWGIVLCYDLKRLDEYEMRQNMMAFGMRGENIEKAVDVLLFHTNTGMCVSRDDIRMSLVFIGNATGKDQWWDTAAHETLYHAIHAIHEYYDIPFGSEDGAWLTGYVMRKAVQLLGEPCL